MNNLKNIITAILFGVGTAINSPQLKAENIDYSKLERLTCLYEQNKEKKTSFDVDNDGMPEEISELPVLTIKDYETNITYTHDYRLFDVCIYKDPNEGYLIGGSQDTSPDGKLELYKWDGKKLTRLN